MLCSLFTSCSIVNRTYMRAHRSPLLRSWQCNTVVTHRHRTHTCERIIILWDNIWFRGNFVSQCAQWALARFIHPEMRVHIFPLFYCHASNLNGMGPRVRVCVCVTSSGKYYAHVKWIRKCVVSNCLHTAEPNANDCFVLEKFRDFFCSLSPISSSSSFSPGCIYPRSHIHTSPIMFLFDSRLHRQQPSAATLHWRRNENPK